MSEFWSIAVDAPMQEALTYSAGALQGQLKRGQSVVVPLGKRTANGVLLNKIQNASTKFEIRDIVSIDEEYPSLPESFLKWIEWLAHYYIYPVGLVARHSFPALSKTQKERKSSRPPVIPDLASDVAPVLTAEQRMCFEAISKFTQFSTHLVHGVTGSGKTEVYLHLLEKTLSEKKAGLVLVPEISLTPQLLQRFVKRFGDQVSLLHSQLTDRERTNQWWDFVEGRKNILVGARSALFCPRSDIGMIVVDEEHEPSFKQDEKLKYHGRDSAVMLGHYLNCPVVLGSATPSLESWYNAREGRYHLHKLENRVAQRAMPNLEIVDLRSQEKELHNFLPFWLSKQLFERLQKSLEKKEQSALFLNRRGMAQMVLCPSCGHTRECPNCDISLTLHAQSHLVCHYCDYHENFKLKCPDCSEGELESIGLGTELIEQDLKKLFPEARIARADRDEISNRVDLESLIQKMEEAELDILIGTQMIAKGLDFPKLNVVGLILADVGFNLPDLRATERSFQLITQMSGRAGRHVQAHESPGEVVIQTFNPDHPSITFAKAHQFEAFAENELLQRQSLNYPPIGRMISFRIQGPDLRTTENAASRLQQRAFQLKSKFETAYQQIEVLGPAEAPIAKIRGVFRYFLLLKGQNHKILNQFARQMVGDEKWLPPRTRILIDVDPLNLL